MKLAGAKQLGVWFQYFNSDTSSVRVGLVLAISNLCIINLVQKETQCFYLQFLRFKLLISKIVLIQWFCLPIITLIA